MSDLDNAQRKQNLLEELAALEACCGNYLFELLPTLEALALVCHAQGAFDEAAAYYLRIIEIREMAQTSQLPEHDLLGLVKAEHCLGLLYRVQDAFGLAEPHYKKALGYSMQLHGPRHIKTIEMQNYLSGLYFAWGKLDRAQQILMDSLSFYESTFGPDDAAVALTLYALALVTRPVAPDQSQAYFKKSVSILHIDLARLTMEEPREFAMGLMQISRERFRQGQYLEAEQLFRQSLLLEMRAIWPGHPLVGDSFQLLGDLYRSFGMAPQAESMYRNAYALRLEVFGPDHLQLAATAHALGVLLADNRRYQEAEGFLARACEIRSKSGFPPVLASSLKVYGTLLKNLNRHEESSKLMAQAQEIFTKYGSSNELM